MEVNKPLPSIPATSRRGARVNLLEVIGNAGMGGMENYIKNLIAHLPADQFQVTCICPYESPFTDSLRQLGVEEVYITPITDDPTWRSIQLTVEVARLHQIDVLHAHMPKAHALAGLAGCLVHKPVVATIHGMDVSSQELGITRAVGSHIITNCQEAYIQSLALGVPAERLDLIRNSVDTTVFTPGSISNDFRKAINVTISTPLVGFVGRLEYEKGPDLFLRAADHVHQLRPEVHFVMVGDGLMCNDVKKMCAHYGLQQHVHFVGWWTNTVEVYPAINFLVHTSRSDGTSLVLLEAMSCECPTIGIAVGGVPEIIENENTGFVVDPGDWEGLTFRILQLLDQPERLQSMKAAARNRVKQHFDLRANTVHIANLLRHIAFPGVNGQRSNNGAMAQVINSKASLGKFKG